MASVTACILASSLSPSRASDLTEPHPELKAPESVLERKRRDYDAIGFRYGTLIFYPSFLSSATFDDNIYSTKTNKSSDLTFHLAPTLSLKGDYGASKVTAYVNADAKISTRQVDLSTVSSGTGVGLTTEFARDFVLKGRADYAYRAEDPSDTNQLLTPGAIRIPVHYHDVTSSLSLHKGFNDLFVEAGTTYEHLAYENVNDVLGTPVNESLRDGDLASWNLRGGYQVGPGLKVFVEPSYNIRRYHASVFDSGGWRMVGGLASEAGRLITGEVYAGYVQQRYQNVFFGTVSGFTAGGSLRWFPTELVTVTVKGDRTITEAGLTQGLTGGSPALVTTASVQADYEVLRNLILTARAGYQKTDYQRNIDRVDNLYSSGLTASYLFNRTLSGSVDYKFSYNDSSAINSSYSRNQISVGLKGQF